ncbi:MAG TPA: hypothetical protein DDW31_00205 [candidate division Zixibacteria bacterium]|nr:hypothetical protein [candidate division Zixibacteria bacterium]
MDNSKNMDKINAIIGIPGVRLTLLVSLFCTLAFPKLGGYGLAVWDDAYYASKAREIQRTGDWVTMHYDDRLMFDNPPGFMWLLALSYKIWGVNDYAAKFPSAVFGTLAIILVYLLAKRMRDEWYGFLTAAVLCLTQPFIRYSRRGMMDVDLTFFIVLALYAFWEAGQGRRKWLYVWGLSSGFAILLKSVLGLFALFIPIVWMLVAGKWDILRRKELYLGLALALVSSGWWFVAEYMKHGRAFVDMHFSWIIFRRSFVVSEGSGKWWEHLSYLKDLVKYYWPWLPISLWGLGALVVGFKRQGKKDAGLLVLVWVASYLFILSAMKARRLWYLMPAFPGLAMLAAHALYGWLSEEKRRLRVVRIMACAVPAAYAAVNFTPLKMDKHRTQDIRSLAPYVRYYSNSGYRIIAYRQDYFALNSGLIFYTGAAAKPFYAEEHELDAAISSGSPTVCIMDCGQFAALSGGVRDKLRLVKQYDNAMMLANGAVLPDTLRIVP